jgi:predicted nucleic acid-binding protein
MINYLVDTSIWIDYFRGKSEAIKNRMTDLAFNNRIYYNGIIISELLSGAKSKKQFDFIIENFSGLNYLEMDKEFFIFSSRITNKLRSLGITLPISDILIAAHAKFNNLIVFTKDKHFEKTGQLIGFQYDIIENVC